MLCVSALAGPIRPILKARIMTYISMQERAQRVNLRAVNALTQSIVNALSFLDDERGERLAGTVRLAAESEKHYRRGRGPMRGFTVNDAARLMVVKWIVEYTCGPHSKLPTLADLFIIRPDCLRCAALAMRHGGEIAAELVQLAQSRGGHSSGLSPDIALRDIVAEVLALDYAACMQKAEG